LPAVGLATGPQKKHICLIQDDKLVSISIKPQAEAYP
jgi:hypothetical protein